MSKRIIVVMVVAALLVAGAFGVAAFRSASAAAGLIGTADKGGAGFRDAGPSEELAAALGISLEELQDAYATARESALDEAVEKDLLTQTQVDELLEKGTNFPFRSRITGWLSDKGIDFQQHLADALNITKVELQAAFLEALNSRIDAAVAAGTLTEERANLLKGQAALFSNDNFQASMQSAFEEAVGQAVTNGIITQEQADQILENHPGFGSFRFEGRGGRGGFDRHEGGFRGHEFGVPDEELAPELTPSGG